VRINKIISNPTNNGTDRSVKWVSNLLHVKFVSTCRVNKCEIYQLHVFMNPLGTSTCNLKLFVCILQNNRFINQTTYQWYHGVIVVAILFSKWHKIILKNSYFIFMYFLVWSGDMRNMCIQLIPKFSYSY
jgi:hypothetical protein